MDNNQKNNSNNEELRKEIEKKQFLKELERKELELMNDNSINDMKHDMLVKNAKKAFKKKVVRTVVMFCLLVVFCFGLSRMFYSIASSITVDTNESINISVVEIAVTNYKRDKGSFPIEADNKINTTLLRQLGYLSSDVENNCDCYFYLKNKNGAVQTVKRK